MVPRRKRKELVEKGSIRVKGVKLGNFFIPFYLFLPQINLTDSLLVLSENHDGLVTSATDSGLRGLGSSPGWVIVLCSWARHFTLTMPFSTQEYKWVPANSQVTPHLAGGVPAMD